MTTILYEPLPAGRIGVRPQDQTAVFATDFSTFAFMLEEFVSLAVTKIAIPSSAPEATMIANIAAPIRNHIHIIDDKAERASVDHALAPIFDELHLARDSEGRLIAPKNTDRDLLAAIRQLDGNLWRLALGFNHGLQLGISPTAAFSGARALRKELRDPKGRAVVAQIEGVLSTYEAVRIETPTLTGQSTTELMNIFDRLINDEAYLEASSVVGNLAIPRTRRAAISRLRAYTRKVLENSPLSIAWTVVTKVFNAWSGATIPEAENLASIVGGHALPMIVDLSGARQRALEMWKTSGVITAALDRAGSAVVAGDVQWLPPLASSRASEPGSTEGILIGSVREFKDALERALEILDRAREEISEEEKVQRSDVGG